MRPATLPGGVVSPAPAVVPNPSSERIPIFAAVIYCSDFVVVGGRLCQTGCIRVRVASWLSEWSISSSCLQQIQLWFLCRHCSEPHRVLGLWSSPNQSGFH